MLTLATPSMATYLNRHSEGLDATRLVPLEAVGDLDRKVRFTGKVLRERCPGFVTWGSPPISAIKLTTGVSGHRGLLEESTNVRLAYPAVVASTTSCQPSGGRAGRGRAHLRQKRVGSIATRSPTLRFVTLDPAWTTVPADSWPSTCGSLIKLWPTPP
jgi:hypothetical protein